MKTAKRVIDFVILLLLACAVYIYISGVQFIVPPSASDEYLLTLVTTLVPGIAGSLASISGILIAVYLLSSQISGRRLYSRLVKMFYGANDLSYFGILFTSLLVSIYIHSFWIYISTGQIYYKKAIA